MISKEQKYVLVTESPNDLAGWYDALKKTIKAIVTFAHSLSKAFDKRECFFVCIINSASFNLKWSAKQCWILVWQNYNCFFASSRFWWSSHQWIRRWASRSQASQVSSRINRESQTFVSQNQEGKGRTFFGSSQSRFNYSSTIFRFSLTTCHPSQEISHTFLQPNLWWL